MARLLIALVLSNACLRPAQARPATGIRASRSRPVGKLPRIALRVPAKLSRLAARVLDGRLPGGSEDAIWAASSAALGTAETTVLASRTTPLIKASHQLAFVGSAALTWTAARSMRQAKSLGERLDAGGDLAWGLEGLLEFSPGIAGKFGALSRTIGTVGGVCQSFAGMRRIWTGVRQRDWCKVKLGALDLASGGLWLAWDLFAIENPLVVGGFIGAMVGREVYANRKELAALGKRAGKRIGERIRRIGRKARDLVDRPRGGSSLRHIAAGLNAP